MSNDWIKHNGGPQPVGDDDWVEVTTGKRAALPFHTPARLVPYWEIIRRYRILNQHLIDAARKEGLQKGLKVYEESRKADEHHIKEVIERARLEGIRLGLEAAHKAICALPVTPESDPERVQDDCADSIAYDLMINIDTIAREAVLDQLTSEAQADNTGYDNEPR